MGVSQSENTFHWIRISLSYMCYYSQDFFVFTVKAIVVDKGNYQATLSLQKNLKLIVQRKHDAQGLFGALSGTKVSRYLLMLNLRTFVSCRIVIMTQSA